MCQKSEQFPKPYRNTVTQRLMDSALDLHEALCAAQSHRGQQRLAALRQGDTCLARLRVYLRLGNSQKIPSHFPEKVI